MEHGFDLDLVEGAIIDFCLNFSLSCQSWIDEGVTYYWFQHENICFQLPMLKLKRDTMYRRMKGLCEKEFLKAHPKNKQNNQSWYALLPNSYLIESATGKKSDGSDENPKGIPDQAQTIGSKSEPSDDNPKGIGGDSEGASDENPINKDIKEEENNLKLIIKNAGETETDDSIPEEKKEPQPQVPPDPFPIPDDEAMVELKTFTAKLQRHDRLLYKLSSESKLKGDEARDWIRRYVLDQWSADKLKERNDSELILHCQRWIGVELQKLQKQTHGSTNGNSGIKRAANTLRPTSIGQPDYRGKGSHCDVEL